LVLHKSSELQGLLPNRLVPWDISFPGATASLGTAADGIKFLVQQSNSKGSAFYMPNHGIAVFQQEWENYLAKLLDMPLHYQMSAEQNIHVATGHLSSDHHVMFGWNDVVANCRACNQGITLNMFADHVRKRLFVQGQTRQQALPRST
jgi:hypothetical protein